MSTLILKTKLFVPKLRPSCVRRTRLIQKMNAGLHQTLTLILAPAGFGKSTVLSEWASEAQRKIAWLSLEDADNDVRRFFSYFILAIQEIHTGLGRDVELALQASDDVPVEHLLTVFINEIVEIEDDVILVLDDYHFIQAEAIHSGIQFLIDHAPSNLHLVVASRVSPPFPITRLRALGQVTEIRSHDLRFTLEEAAALLNDQMDLTLSDEEVAALQMRTEGWITGLHRLTTQAQCVVDHE